MPRLDRIRLDNFQPDQIKKFQKIIKALNSFENQPVQTIEQLLTIKDTRGMNAKIMKECAHGNQEISIEDIESFKNAVTLESSLKQKTALKMLNNHQQLVFPTGCTSVDDALGGGFYSNEISELCGSSASGKTQTCISTVLTAALNKRKCVYITENASSVLMRLRQMTSQAVISSSERETALCNINIVTMVEVMGLLHILESLLHADSDIDIVVVDSLSHVIGPLGNSYSDPSSSGLLCTIAILLKKIAREKRASILTCSNFLCKQANQQVQCKKNPPEKCSAFEIWASFVHTELFFEGTSGNNVCTSPYYTMRLKRCPFRTAGVCFNYINFVITDDGLSNIP